MFGSGWLKRAFDGDPQTRLFGSAPSTAQTAEAAPAASGGEFRFVRAANADAAQTARPKGWWPALAQTFAVVGDVGRGLDGQAPLYAPALHNRWAAAAKSRAEQGSAASGAEILQKALAEVPAADRPGLEALIRNAPTMDDALRYIGEYQTEQRGRRNALEDEKAKRNLAPEGMVEDPTTGKLRYRAGWPVPGVPGHVFDEKGAIVELAGYARTPEGRQALANLQNTIAQTGYYRAQTAAKTAEGASQGKPLEYNQKAAAVLPQAVSALRMLAQLEASGGDGGKPYNRADFGATVVGNINAARGFNPLGIVKETVGGLIPNTETTRKYDAAMSALSEAWLRTTSGASITPNDVAQLAEQMRPAPNDSEDVRRYKASLRAEKVFQLLDAAGPALRPEERAQYQRLALEVTDPNYGKAAPAPAKGKGGLASGPTDAEILAALKARNLN